MALTKRLFMVSGLPRSGSTLLANVLAQNPQIHSTPSSGLIDLLVEIRNYWGQNVFMRALPHEQSQALELDVLRGVVNGYFGRVERPIVCDKNRAWPRFLEMAAAILGDRSGVRVLVTVRDLRDVLASFERLHRETSALDRPPQEVKNPAEWLTAAGRVRTLIKDDQPVGFAYTVIRDAITRGWRGSMHFVDYDEFTREPERIMSGIYEFLGMDNYGHRFDAVEQATVESDREHGFSGLHTIRPIVEPQSARWPTMFDRSVFDNEIWKQVERVATFWRTE